MKRKYKLLTLLIAGIICMIVSLFFVYKVLAMIFTIGGILFFLSILLFSLSYDIKKILRILLKIYSIFGLAVCSILFLVALLLM